VFFLPFFSLVGFDDEDDEACDDEVAAVLDLLDFLLDFLEDFLEDFLVDVLMVSLLFFWVDLVTFLPCPFRSLLADFLSFLERFRFFDCRGFDCQEDFSVSS